MRRSRSFTVLIALVLIAGCGEKDEPAPPTKPLAAAPGPTGDRQNGQPGQAGPAGDQGPAAEHHGGGGPGPAERAADDAARVYRSYIAAINARDGEGLCRLVPGLERALRPPVDRGSCAATIRASIGYRDPRGYPVWAETTLSGIEGTDVDLEAATARITAAIVTRFADRAQPSSESDIAYLRERDGQWRLAQPTGALYRAIGRPEPPPGAIAPPSQ